MEPVKITLPKWYDLHAHFRQGALLSVTIADHLAMGCAGILAMPNTKPPVGRVFATEDGPFYSIESYRRDLERAGAQAFSTLITPLYLTQETTPAMIEGGAKAGLLQACKYYPPHGTTGAEHAADLDFFIKNGVFRAMEEAGIVLCLHGEEHGLPPESYFTRDSSAETLFYRNRAPRLIDAFPALRMVAEHVTTADAATLVRQAGTMAATVTPQHLLYTVGHLLQGLKYHLYCLPILKFETDRQALRDAVTAPDNTKFFAGTDSAPHTRKATACGCAAGCYTGGVAPQLYAQAFETAGVRLDTPEGQAVLERFLCRNGAAFYGLPVPQAYFSLEKREQFVTARQTPEGMLVPLPLGLAAETADRAVLPWTLENAPAA